MEQWSVVSLGNRPAIFPVLLFTAGVATGPEWGFGWAPWVTFSVLWAAVSWWRAPRAGSLWALLAASFCLGATVAKLHRDSVFGVPANEPAAVLLEGEVESVRLSDRGRSVVLEVSRVDERPARFRAALFATAGTPTARLEAGQRVVVPAKTKRLSAPNNPAEYSDFTERERQGQVVTGSFDAERLLVLSPPSWLAHWLGTAHQALKARVSELSDRPAANALFLTLAAGERADLGTQLEDEFARSGLAHILSVSGLHVAVLALALLAAVRRGLVWLPGRRWRRVDARRLAAPVAVPLVWAYVVFTNEQAPAVRSAVMCTLVLVGLSIQRRGDALNSLAIAAGAMAAVDPSAVFDLSVQLSFVAVASLIVLGPALRELVALPKPDPRLAGWARRWGQAKEAALQTFLASVAVTLAGLPLVLAAFQRVGWAGLVSNVVALPLSGALTLTAALGSATFVTCPPLSTPLLWVGVQLSEALLWCAKLFASLPGATWALPGMPLALALAWWGGLGALAFSTGRWRLLALATPLAGFIHVGAWFDPAPSGMEVTFLSVGHGDAIVVSSRGHHALVDAGGVPNGADTGVRMVVPFLREHRIDSLDLAVLSHPHPDHALGLMSTLRAVPTERLWLPAGADAGPLVDGVVAAAGRARVERVEVGHSALTVGDATVEVLGPPNDRVLLESENDRSVVLLVRHGQVTVLLAGDVEEAGEELVKTGPVTVMKAPHHGSRTSSSPPLLEQARPRFVVFCVGKNNRFGFPHSEVVERYRALGAECFRTDLDGAVYFQSDGHDVKVTTFHPTATSSVAQGRHPRPTAGQREHDDGEGDAP